MMQRRWGLVIGMSLLAVGTLGGVALAATQGATRGVPAAGSPSHTVYAMMGGAGRGGSSGFGGMMASAMNQYMGNTHAIMGDVGSGGDMMGTASGSAWAPIHVAALVRQSERGVTIDRATNTITYHSAHDLVVPLAAPAALHLPGMQWEIDGLINPTVVVPRGAQVTVDLVNADQGYMHGFEVTKATPPFQEMAMMQGTAAFPGAFVMPIWPETSHGQYHRSTQFTAATAGTYHYICPVPGHAAHGMAGQFVVS